MMKYHKRAFSAIYRIVQLLFSIAALGVSAAGVHLMGSWEKGNFSIAVSALSCVYLISALTLYKYFTAIVALCCDIIGFVLWIISFALVTQVWSGADCSYDFSSSYYYYYIDFDWSKICHVYMVVIAFGAVNWVSYLGSIFCIARLTSRKDSSFLVMDVLSYADEPVNDIEAAVSLEAAPPANIVNDVSQPEETKLN
ncbi:predicted protein [Meyerozyma guilliermondii ATCC 6260]|uniref:MARVEL domain-containing protein n=1 Tax=Meyerozyma guilliermondii (strain ATCC 6260 / CBS 566 / DSM 6381 / JCM 1539 / NBRC 10279 / NRRL Y-324) TaxID=294746 RepID=A5D9Q2_PICGU|nr:uncharacterized protein PGUG_00003 [Meyerozyma guilliermondii ATCC 6260]EDK35905.2 predicted protein [Meyerozyma guilliermondii ATCC 6260]